MPGEHEIGRHASSRARLVLRRLKGRGRKSSPSSVRMSKAYGLDFVIVLARVQDIEIGNTVNPKDGGFATTN